MEKWNVGILEQWACRKLGFKSSPLFHHSSLLQLHRKKRRRNKEYIAAFLYNMSIIISGDDKLIFAGVLLKNCFSDLATTGNNQYLVRVQPLEHERQCFSLIQTNALDVIDSHK